MTDDCLGRLEKDVEDLQGSIGALAIVADQADDLRWSDQWSAKACFADRRSPAGGDAPSELRPQRIEVLDQVRQQMFRAGRFVLLQQVGDLDDGLVIRDDAHHPVTERGNTHVTSSSSASDAGICSMSA